MKRAVTHRSLQRVGVRSVQCRVIGQSQLVQPRERRRGIDECANAAAGEAASEAEDTQRAELTGARRQTERRGAVVAYAVVVCEERHEARRLSRAESAHQRAEAAIGQMSRTQPKPLQGVHGPQGRRETADAVITDGRAAIELQGLNGAQRAALSKCA